MNIVYLLFLVLTVSNSSTSAATSSFVRTSSKRALIPVKRFNSPPKSSLSTQRRNFGSSKDPKSTYMAAAILVGLGLGFGYLQSSLPLYPKGSLQSQFYSAYHITGRKPIVNNYIQAVSFVHHTDVDAESFEYFIRVLDDDSDCADCFNIGNIEDVIFNIYKKINCDQKIVKNTLRRIEFKSKKVQAILYYLASLTVSKFEECQVLESSIKFHKNY